MRRRFLPDAPHDYVTLKQAAHSLGLARQTVLNQVRRGQRDAIHVTQGKRGGLSIQLHPHRARPPRRPKNTRVPKTTNEPPCLGSCPQGQSEEDQRRRTVRWVQRPPPKPRLARAAGSSIYVPMRGGTSQETSLPLRR